MNKLLNTAINNVYKEVGYVQKEGRINFGNTNYKFAGEADFIKAIRPAMTKYGLAIVPVDIELLSYLNGMAVVKVEYELLHISGEFKSIKMIGTGKDSSDKAVPKALTGAYKYALRQSFMIETGDDPDNTASGIHVLVDQISDFLDITVSLDVFNKKSKGVQDAIDTLKNAPYTDYAMLNKKFKQLKETLTKEAKKPTPKADQDVPIKKTRAQANPLDRLFAKLYACSDVHERIKYLQGDSIRDWLLKTDKQTRYQIFKRITEEVNTFIEANDNGIDINLDLLTQSQLLAVYYDDIGFIDMELNVSVKLMDVVDGYERKSKELGSILPDEAT